MCYQNLILKPGNCIFSARTRLVFDLLTQILKDLFRESK